MSIKAWVVASTTTALMAGAVGCGSDNEQPAANAANPGTSAAPAAGAAGTPGATITVADIVGNPDRYAGQTVTVEADVEEVLSPFAFALDEDSPLAGGIDNDLLVFSPKSANLADIDDQWLKNKVRVTGRVVRMGVVEIEREIGWDLDRQIEIELEKKRPALIAQTVQRTGR